MSGQRKAIAHPRISLRLPQDLLDSIKSAANARDVPYQSLITAWLQEKVQQAESAQQAQSRPGPARQGAGEGRQGTDRMGPIEPAQDQPAGSLQEDDDDLDGPTPHTM